MRAEVFLYRCDECGTVNSTSVRVTPSSHQARCPVCWIHPTQPKSSTLHHAIVADRYEDRPFYLVVSSPPIAQGASSITTTPEP